MIDFEFAAERRGGDSAQWNRYEADVLPFWLADMDYPPPDAVRRALQQRLDDGVFGYPETVFHDPLRCGDLPAAIGDWLWTHYRWQVQPEEIVLLPGVVTGFNLACHAAAGQGGEAVVMTPVYTPMLEAPANAGLARRDAPWLLAADGYVVDWDRFAAAFSELTRVFLLCNPHNPVGRVFRREELERAAEICLQKGAVICADEIHSDLIYPGFQHLPIATLSPEVARQTITLMAPSKTFNIAGLQCAFAIIQDGALRSRFTGAHKGLVNWVTSLGLAAGAAAYRHGEDWLRQLLAHLDANRALLADFVRRELPGVGLHEPEGTYLAWLDFRGMQKITRPGKYFLQHARVGLGEGVLFGPGGEGFARLNFACPAARLLDGLQRMKAALAGGKYLLD